MDKTAIIYSPEYLRHKTGFKHPECPSRLRVIMRELKNSRILRNEKCSLVEPEAASLNDLKRVHDTNYVQQIQRFCRCGGGMLDREDTVVSRESYDAAVLAAGGALKAVDLVMSGGFRNAFAFVRPPGHHAGFDYPMGFCVFNNVAVAAKYLLERFGLDRVLVLDVDAHHGNGTQDVFFGSKNVLYVSLHEDPVEFPLTGFADEVGEDDGLGYTVNVPLPYGADDRVYLKAFHEVAVPIIGQYKPQFVLVSTGFDSYYADPVGNLSASSRSYIKVFDAVLELASKFCDGKVVAVLEGGYNLRVLGRLACAAVARLAGVSYVVGDKPHGSGAKVHKTGDMMLEQVKMIQSQFWDLR